MPDGLSQVIRHLVENALKYGIEPRPQGGRLVIRAARQLAESGELQEPFSQTGFRYHSAAIVAGAEMTAEQAVQRVKELALERSVTAALTPK